MKKNNSFRMTFYLGLTIIGLAVSFLTLIAINVYDALTPKFKKDKLEIYIDDVKPEKEIVYDTIYIDRPRVKNNDTPKNVTIVTTKKTPIVSEKNDTTIVVDTIK